jgi:hypothetical protein
VQAKIKHDNADVWMAYEVLKLMKLLNVVFLQDAAAIWVLHPERKEHPIFSMPVFHHADWLVRVFVFLFFGVFFVFACYSCVVDMFYFMLLLCLFAGLICLLSVYSPLILSPM